MSGLRRSQAPSQVAKRAAADRVSTRQPKRQAPQKQPASEQPPPAPASTRRSARVVESSATSFAAEPAKPKARAAKATKNAAAKADTAAGQRSSKRRKRATPEPAEEDAASQPPPPPPPAAGKTRLSQSGGSTALEPAKGKAKGEKKQQPAAGSRQSRRIANKVAEPVPAEDGPDSSGSESDEEWSLPRPKESARVKLRVGPTTGKQRATYRAGQISVVDDVKKTFAVAFEDGQQPTQQEFKWKQAGKGDLTFEDAAEGLCAPPPHRTASAPPLPPPPLLRSCAAARPYRA